MGFDSTSYGAEIARILASAGHGLRPMPLVRSLVQSSASSWEAGGEVSKLGVSPSVRAGLFLYLGCWDDAHNAADSIENTDGYFWHAMAHRQEPDAWNSGYWFRKTGDHPIFPKLVEGAGNVGYHAGSAWDPYGFVDFCGKAQPQSDQERLAIDVQLLEWQLLFDFCMRGARG
jgi:hypothetical protein